MKHLIDFIERHKKFVKKLIVFVIAYFVLAVVNKPEFTLFFEQFFGEYMTIGLNALVPTTLLTMEV